MSETALSIASGYTICGYSDGSRRHSEFEVRTSKIGGMMDLNRKPAIRPLLHYKKPSAQMVVGAGIEAAVLGLEVLHLFLHNACVEMEKAVQRSESFVGRLINRMTKDDIDYVVMNAQRLSEILIVLDIEAPSEIGKHSYFLLRRDLVVKARDLTGAMLKVEGKALV